MAANRFRQNLRRRTALTACAVLPILCLAPAAQATAPQISVAEPDGFADVTREQTLVVDVFFGGARKGEAKVIVGLETIRFVDPEAVLALLPPLADKESVAAVISGSGLPTHSTLACSPGADRAVCGRLSPDTVGVIFDRERFRVDVFLNPRFVAVEDRLEDKYLPAPSRDLSMINAIAAVVSGQSGAERTAYNFQDQLVLAAGERRLRADLSYADELGFAAERLAFEWDRPGLRYSAGALWVPGDELSGRRKLLGLGVETQIDTRRDKDEALGSTVIVYLDRRAQVDVIRDGRVLSSAIYEAGNQQIDTATLPEGSYDIVLRIREAGHELREERRFYTKSRRIPAPGRTDFYAFGGVLVEGREGGSLNPSSHPYLQGAVFHRLDESWAIEGGVQASDRGAAAQFGATLLTRIARLRAMAVAESHGGVGGIVQLASSGTSRLNFNIDLRHIEGDGQARLAAGTPRLTAQRARFASPELLPPEDDYLQLGGAVSYSLANFRFLGTLFYRRESEQAARYSVGPSLEWDVLRKGPFALTLRGDVTATERGQSGFAGLSVRLLGARSSVTALAGARRSDMDGDDLGDGAVAAVGGTWQAGLAGGELALGAGYEHQPRQDNLILSSDFRHRLGSLAGDFVHTDAGTGAVSQYSLGFQTTLAATADTVQVAGKSATESLVVARVSGARETDRFDVLVNEQPAGTIEGSRPLTLALPAYRAYDLRIRPAGDGLIAYDSSPRSIGSYPGVVTKLEWAATAVSIKFGRLVLPDGSPVRGASLTGKGIWSETDDNGFFQIEAPDGVPLTVTLGDGRSFVTTLAPARPGTGIASLGAIVCCGNNEIRLGALDPLRMPGDGGSK